MTSKVDDFIKAAKGMEFTFVDSSNDPDSGHETIEVNVDGDLCFPDASMKKSDVPKFMDWLSSIYRERVLEAKA